MLRTTVAGSAEFGLPITREVDADLMPEGG